MLEFVLMLEIAYDEKSVDRKCYIRVSDDR